MLTAVNQQCGVWWHGVISWLLGGGGGVGLGGGVGPGDLYCKEWLKNNGDVLK